MSFILKWFVLVGVLLGSLQSAPKTLTTEKWFWASIPQKQQLVAYSSDGTVNVLLEGIYPFKLKRVDNQTAVVMIKLHDEYRVYVVNPTSAYFVTVLYKQDYVSQLEKNNSINEISGPPGVEAMSVIDNKILIWNNEMAISLLFDPQIATTSSLPLEQWAEMRVSQNGQFLRYRVKHETKSNLLLDWTLYEYDVLSGARQTVFRRNQIIPAGDISVNESCTPDRFGEQWYCVKYLGRYEGSRPVTSAQIITLDGQIRPMDIKLHLKETPTGQWYFMASDQYDIGCGDGCKVAIFSVNGELVNTFSVNSEALPKNTSLNLVYSEVLDVNRLILDDGFGYGTLYILNMDSQLTYLGAVPCAPCTPASADGRWRILYDLRTTPKTVVWDLQKGVIVLQRDGFYDSHGYVDGGIFLYGGDYYSIVDERDYSLDQSLYPGGLIDILPDGVFIYAQGEELEGMPVGIYRYTEKEGKVLLINGGKVIDYSSPQQETGLV